MTTRHMTKFDDLFRKPEPPTAPVIPHPAIVNTNGSTPYGAKALAEELAILAGTTEGSRNHQLNVSAYNLAQLVASGHLNPITVHDQLRTTALAIGLTATETDATLKSAFAAGTQQPRDVPELPPTVIEVTASELLAQKSFWQQRDILQHIQQFAYARMISPWSLLGVCMLRMLAVIPPHVVLPPLIGGYGSLNLFVALVGPSGVGKGASEAAAIDAIDYCTDIYTAPVGSGEGIAHQYAHRDRSGVTRDRDSVLFEVSEVDTLTALGNRQGSTLLSQLRSAFSGERLGFGYADATRRIPIERHTYRLGMVIGVQPEKAGPVVYDADGGTPQRVVWFPATDPEITPEPSPAPPQWVIPAPAMWLPTRDMKHVLTIPDTVAGMIRRNHAARARGEGEALDGHALFAREKVAFALTLLDQRREVTDEDWELSGVVMRISDITRAKIMATLAKKESAQEHVRAEKEAIRAVHVASSVDEAAIKRVAAQIEKKVDAAGSMPWAELRRGTAHRDRMHFEEAASRLVAAGQIRVEDAEKGRQVVKGK